MREVKRHAMNYGLYTGCAYIITILIFHFMGHLHFPGDQIGWINAGIMAFLMARSGRKVKYEICEGIFPFKTSAYFTIVLGISSAIVLAVFSYFYYGFISPEAIANFINQMEIALSSSATMPSEQQEALVELYKANLTAGSMTFISLFSQSFVGLVIGLFIALFLRTNTPQQHN